MTNKGSTRSAVGGSCIAARSVAAVATLVLAAGMAGCGDPDDGGGGGGYLTPQASSGTAAGR